MHALKSQLPCKKAIKPERPTTINDLFATDEVNGLLHELDEERPNISDIVVIWVNNKDNQPYYDATPNTLKSTITWLLESTKLCILNDDEED